MLLPTGAQHAHEDLLGLRAVLSTVAAPAVTSNDGRANGALGNVVGGIQAGAMEKGEYPGLLMSQMAWQSGDYRVPTSVGEASGSPGDYSLYSSAGTKTLPVGP